jgi:hypothetical protein
MIIVLFPAGAFGSTVEYCLRQFSNELTKVVATIVPDGSMHTFQKEFHPLTIDQFVQRKHDNFEIVTPVYPGKDYLSPRHCIDQLVKNINVDQKALVIYFSSLKMAERNQLFCYYKIPTFLDTIMKNKHVSWNVQYKSWKDMQPFELREALSFFIDQQSQHLEVTQHLRKNWLFITPDDLLYNFEITILNIMKYFQLTVDTEQNIGKFADLWATKQKYILEEFKQIEQITNDINSNLDLAWNKLSIIGEAIIQSRLRRKGLEIACDQLNQFPTTIHDLQKLILERK